MDIRKIRYYEGKETRVEWAEVTKDDTDERKRVSKQAPERAFVDALQAFLPLLVSACGLGDVWVKSGVVTGLTFGEEKAAGGGTRLNLMIHGRCTPEGQSSPVLLNSPLMREASDENMIGKPGVIPADYEDRITTVKDQAIRFLQGHRAQPALPLAPAA